MTSDPTRARFPGSGRCRRPLPMASLNRCCHAGHVRDSVRPAGPFDRQAAFTEAARLVSADVYTTTTLRAPFTIHFDDDVEMFLYTFSGHTFGPLVATSEPAPVVFLADLVQVDVIERFWQPWPECPGHGHPARPVLRLGQPAWVCPQTDDLLAEIGRLTPR
jgi:hypothetical protein